MRTRRHRPKHLWADNSMQANYLIRAKNAVSCRYVTSFDANALDWSTCLKGVFI